MWQDISCKETADALDIANEVLWTTDTSLVMEIAGVPKTVHKFEIKNLCSENRSISKVGVICYTSPQL